MRLPAIAACVALALTPAATLAQTTPSSPPAGETTTGPPSAKLNGLTREIYIQRAEQRAARRAGERFDEMDADHDGVLTRDEIRAWHQAHPRHARNQNGEPPAESR